MEEPDRHTPRRIKPAVRVEPAGVQSLPIERKSGEAVGLPLRRSHAQLSAERRKPRKMTPPYEFSLRAEFLLGQAFEGRCECRRAARPGTEGYQQPLPRPDYARFLRIPGR